MAGKDVWLGPLTFRAVPAVAGRCMVSGTRIFLDDVVSPFRCVFRPELDVMAMGCGGIPAGAGGVAGVVSPEAQRI